MVLFAQSGPTTLIILGMLALVIGWVLFRTHRSFLRQKQDDAALMRTLRPQQTDSGHHLDAPTEALRWEVQMHETARELSAQLDSKMAALQALIAEADRAAARLEAAAVGVPEATPQPDRPDPKPTTQAEALLPSGRSDSIRKETIDAPDRSLAERRREEIYTLADYGLGTAEIAHRLDTPVGEVDLILSLRDKR